MKENPMNNLSRWSIAAVVLTIAAWAMTASAASVYDLRDISIEAIDEVSSFTLTVNGISATLTALNGGASNPGTVLNRTASGFGVNSVGSGDATDQIDAIQGPEAVRLVFDQDVKFTQLVLALYSTPGQSPPGDQASLSLPGGTVFPLAMTSAIDTYNFSSNNFIAAGQAVDLDWVQGNGFSFNSFTVEASPSVPLPSTASAGLLAMGLLLTSGRFLRRPRAV
jgi:hypothetical protein